MTPNLKRPVFTLCLWALTIVTYAQKVYDITTYGAKADGKTLNTKAIQAALDAAGQTGGTVYIPKGTYYTGSLRFRSNTTVELAAGSTLLASTNLNDYEKLTWGHHEDRTPWHFIILKDVENVRVTGLGTIDGNGKSFWKPDRKNEWSFYTEIEERPSPMFEVQNAKRILIENITIQHSAGWGLHLFNSDDVKCLGLTIKNSMYGPNSDGIDVTGSRNVIISNCHIDVGDDGIALKTTEDSNPVEYVAITNCVISTNCVALRVGYESRKDLRYITANNIVVKRSSRFIDVRSIEGAVIEHVNLDNIVGTTNCGWPINRVVELELDTVYSPYPVEIKEHPNYHKPKPVLKKGAIRDISISNLSAVTDGRLMLAAANGFEVSNIRLHNIHLEYPMIDEPSPLADKAQSIGFFKRMQDVRSAHAAIVAKNIDHFSLDGVSIKWPTYPVPQDWLLIKSPWRDINKTYYEGNDASIISGAKRPAYQVFWGKDLPNNTLNLGNAQASEPGHLKPSTVE